MIIVKILLFLGAGVFNALMDKLTFHYSTSIFPKEEKNETLLGKGERFWNPKFSSENKNRFKNKYIRLLFRTVLVWTTDPWHFFQFMMLNCFTLACLPQITATWTTVWVFVQLRIAFSVGFTLFFDLILKRKQDDSHS